MGGFLLPQNPKRLGRFFKKIKKDEKDDFFILR